MQSLFLYRDLLIYGQQEYLAEIQLGLHCCATCIFVNRANTTKMQLVFTVLSTKVNAMPVLLSLESFVLGEVEK